MLIWQENVLNERYHSRICSSYRSKLYGQKPRFSGKNYLIFIVITRQSAILRSNAKLTLTRTFKGFLPLASLPG